MGKLSSIEILLVEDNPTDAELTTRELQKKNIANKIHWVKDGAEALEYVFCTGKYSDREINHVPRVILLDLKLPKVSGIEVLRKIKADERTKHVPVVVLTSSKEEPDVKTCYDLGVNSYIVKPVEFEGFVKAVQELGLYWILLNEPPTI
ncbi:MAG: response regulator [Nitrospirota bacterium]